MMAEAIGFNIIMYHYVRDLAASAFPAIKGLDVSKFEFQLDYLQRTRRILQPSDVREVVLAGDDLPAGACWLTFDDGYLDHYDVVFPRLEERGLKGSFFPPVLTTSRQDVLDVNKIHFILAAAPSAGEVLYHVEASFEAHNVAGRIGASFSELVSQIDVASRYDSPNVIRVKRLLQRDLPQEIRTEMSNDLFRRYVADDISEFANELYMNVDQLREMHDAGHEIGIHGYQHNWLESLSFREQEEDIKSAVRFYRNENLLPQQWTMCYPYGSFNLDTLKIVSDLGCAVGITTVAERSATSGYEPLQLSRLDTNDFPQE